jgi:hypothetical protein
VVSRNITCYYKCTAADPEGVDECTDTSMLRKIAIWKVGAACCTLNLRYLCRFPWRLPVALIGQINVGNVERSQVGR